MVVKSEEKRKMTREEAGRKGGEKVARGARLRILQGNRKERRREQRKEK